MPLWVDRSGGGCSDTSLSISRHVGMAKWKFWMAAYQMCDGDENEREGYRKYLCQCVG